MSTGIKFHTEGAAERKAREPIAVLIRGTVRVPDSDDLKRRPETYGVILHARPVDNSLKVRTAILKSIRRRTGNQCRVDSRCLVLTLRIWSYGTCITMKVPYDRAEATQ